MRVLAHSDSGYDPGWLRLHAWFAQRGWTPAPFQQQLWQAWREGRSGLLHAPTGSGKTLAVWGGVLLDALAAKAPPAAGLRVLWITPLRALAADTLENLRAPSLDLGLGLAIELRTSDTSSSARARQRKRPPFALITTPESLSLRLSHADEQGALSKLDAIIVDEWHELLGSKRGVQLELCLARLRDLNPRLKIWGVSATLGNLDQAMQVLLGPGVNGTLIQAPEHRRLIIDSALPAQVERFPWAGHLGLRQLPQVLDSVLTAQSTLLFTNTRAQAELWFQALSAVWPLDNDTLALHHGSLDAEHRREVEQGLREGRLRAVVATSSLDLGVDFCSVDQVVQIGSPKGIARLLQRAGRSGHRPGQVSRIRFVATQMLELLEIVATRRALARGRIEAREPLRRSLDVLAQHLVTLALGGGFERTPMLAEVRRCHAFADLGDSEFDQVLDLITRGGASLASYPDYQRVQLIDGRYRIEDRKLAQRHRWGIGTIVADSQMQVRFVSGGYLGSVEESFLTRLKPGDRFQFAGRSLELVRIHQMQAQVRRVSGRAGAVPRWMGGKLPLSSDLADEVLQLLAHPFGDEPEWLLLGPMLRLQQQMSALPRPGVLLIERLRTREGHHLALYPYAGRSVHEGLAPLLGARIGRLRPASFSYAVNDHGLMLSSRAPITLAPEQVVALLDPAGLMADIEASVNLAELGRRQFREIAQIAGLVLRAAPGRQRSVRQLQVSSSLLFDVLSEHDPGHVLLGCARREVLEQQLEYQRLLDVLQRLGAARVEWREPQSLTPFSFPLWAERLRGQLSLEDWQTRVRAMAEAMEVRHADKAKRP